jgi:hypothetical protein
MCVMRTNLPHRRHLPASVKDVRNIFQIKIGVDSPSSRSQIRRGAIGPKKERK